MDVDKFRAFSKLTIYDSVWKKSVLHAIYMSHSRKASLRQIHNDIVRVLWIKELHGTLCFHDTPFVRRYERKRKLAWQ